MVARSRLILGFLIFAAPASARAGEFAQVPPTPGMALTLPAPGMANSEMAERSTSAAGPAPPQNDPLEGRRNLSMPGSGFPSVAGRLPNQRTGSRHQHVVHDICIGC